MARFEPTHRRRQAPGPLPVPSAAGISGGATIDPAAAPTGTALQIDGSASSGPNPTADFSFSTLPGPSPTSPDPSPSADGAAASTSSAPSHAIPISTVVGACVGAFAGLVFLICIALWLYNRSTSALRARSRAPLTPLARKRGELGRAPSRGDPWNKIESGDGDKWAAQSPTKIKNEGSPASPPPMEKLTMFKKQTPSMRTATTRKSHEDMAMANIDSARQPHPYNPYGNTSGSSGPLAPIDTSAAQSWGAEVDASYLSFRSSNLDENTTRSLSPTANPPRQTPTVVESPLSHHWESAEVVILPDNSVNSTTRRNNPFADAAAAEASGSGSRRSLHNPFFNAQHETDSKPPSNDAKAPERSTGYSSINPFDSGDESAASYLSATDTLVPPPAIGSGSGTHSASSSMSESDRAIQSILAVLDDTESHVAQTPATPTSRRVVSGVSTLGESVVSEDVTHAFPLPPRAPTS